ncbi:hypothetical protein V8E36_009977 [Tilletia maclaganii]
MAATQQQLPTSEMGPPPSTPKRFSGGTHSSSSHSFAPAHDIVSLPLPTPPTSQFEGFHSPTQTPSAAVALTANSATGGAVIERTPLANATVYRDRMPTSPPTRTAQVTDSRSFAARAGSIHAPNTSNSGSAQSQRQGGDGAYTYDDAYARSRTPSPILPRMQSLPDATTSTGDGHLTFPPFGPSQAHMDSILHDRATDIPDPSLMNMADLESLVLMVQQLAVQLANTENVNIQQLMHTAKTLGEQALAYAQSNADLKTALNNTRIHAVSAINALTASASHATVQERDLRQRLQAELEGSRQQSRMLAGMIGRASAISSANRNRTDEEYAVVPGDASGSEVTENFSASELLKERNKLLADKRFLKNRVKDAEGQVTRLEAELKALRPFIVRTGSGPRHSVNSAYPGNGRANSFVLNNAYISDPFALGSTAPFMHPHAPASPTKRERGVFTTQSSSSQRRRRAATLGDAGSEHLLLAARRYREVSRRAESAAVQAHAERVVSSLGQQALHGGYAHPGYQPHENRSHLPTSPLPQTYQAANVHTVLDRASFGSHQPQQLHDVQEGQIFSNGQPDQSSIPYDQNPATPLGIGVGSMATQMEPTAGLAAAAHTYNQRPLSSLLSIGPFGNSGPGFGSVGPTPRTPPPVHDRLPRVARTEGSISRIRSIPGSPRGSPSAGIRGAEWPRAGSTSGLAISGPNYGHNAGHPSSQGSNASGSGMLSELLNAAQSVFRPGQEGRALVQSRIQDQRGRRPDLRGLGHGGPSVGPARDSIAYERDEDDNDSLPYSEDDSEVDELVSSPLVHDNGTDAGDESFAKNILGSPKRRRVSAALNSPSKRVATARKQPISNVPDSPTKDRTPRPSKGKSKGSSGSAGTSNAAGLSALDLLADQAAASSNQSQHSGDSGSEQASHGPLALGGSNRRYSGADEDRMDVESLSPHVGGSSASQEKRSTYTRWSAEEDTKLRAAIKQHGQRWEMVSRAVETRSYHQCRQRYLLLRRKEAAKKDGNGASGARADNDPATPKASGSSSVSASAPGSPNKAESRAGGSRSERSYSEDEGDNAVQEIDSEHEVVSPHADTIPQPLISEPVPLVVKTE